MVLQGDGGGRGWEDTVTLGRELDTIKGGSNVHSYSLIYHTTLAPARASDSPPGHRGAPATAPEIQRCGKNSDESNLAVLTKQSIRFSSI